MEAVIREHCGDAIVVWTQIRSFIKGSLEAVLKGRPLLLEEYLDLSAFGDERCRLSMEQRSAAYATYQEYSKLLASEGLWDDSDRVLSMLVASKLQPLCGCNGKDGDYDRVYVDEVQDSTQAETVLYLLAAGMNVNALFLAGDPAQSVVEGVDFRFEEVRSIVHQLSGGCARIERPVKLLVNYRSHTGILAFAGSILGKLFAVYAGAAKVLPSDEGLFQGPRPAYSTSGLCDVLRMNQRLVVICRDEAVAAAEKVVSAAGLSNIVLGIRAAKGLEFQDVVLFDFFGGAAAEDHKAWKALFTKEAKELAPYSHPQLEWQLKLLYTGATRSCNRLVFVEAQQSRLYGVFCGWLRRLSLAEPLQVSEEATLMTSDEWRAQSIEFALSAEGAEEASMLSRAVHFFRMAGDDARRNRAEAQLQLCQVLLEDYGCTLSAVAEVEVAMLLERALVVGAVGVKRVLKVLSERVRHRAFFMQEVLSLL